jgi:hypothetical protein
MRCGLDGHLKRIRGPQADLTFSERTLAFFLRALSAALKSDENPAGCLSEVKFLILFKAASDFAAFGLHPIVVARSHASALKRSIGYSMYTWRCCPKGLLTCKVTLFYTSYSAAMGASRKRVSTRRTRSGEARGGCCRRIHPRRRKLASLLTAQAPPFGTRSHRRLRPCCLRSPTLRPRADLASIIVEGAAAYATADVSHPHRPYSAMIEWPARRVTEPTFADVQSRRLSRRFPQSLRRRSSRPPSLAHLPPPRPLTCRPSGGRARFMDRSRRGLRTRTTATGGYADCQLTSLL